MEANGTIVNSTTPELVLIQSPDNHSRNSGEGRVQWVRRGMVSEHYAFREFVRGRAMGFVLI